jgi:hypothetical protein
MRNFDFVVESPEGSGITTAERSVHGSSRATILRLDNFFFTT